MHIDLESKIVFISDGDTKIGKNLASILISWGMRVVINVNNDQIRKEYNILMENKDFFLVSRDLSRIEDIKKTIQDIDNKYGGLDCLILNNISYKRITIEKCKEKTFDLELDKMVRSAFFCTKLFGEFMGTRKCGNIIYLSTLHSSKPNGFAFVHSVAMGMIDNLSKEAAIQLGRLGIMVNNFIMGPVLLNDVDYKSNFTTAFDGFRIKTPMKIDNESDQLAKMIGLLISNEINLLNGANIRLDGGFMLHFLDPKANYYWQRR